MLSGEQQVNYISSLIRYIIQNDFEAFKQTLKKLKENNILQQIVNQKDERGFTPIQYAAMHGKLSMAMLLVNVGAKIECENPEASPFMLALERHHHVLAKFFVMMGADVHKIHQMFEKKAQEEARELAVLSSELRIAVPETHPDQLEQFLENPQIPEHKGLLENLSRDLELNIAAVELDLEHHRVSQSWIEKQRIFHAMMDQLHDPKHASENDLLVGIIFRVINNSYFHPLTLIKLNRLKEDKSTSSLSLEPTVESPKTADLTGFREFAAACNDLNAVEFLLPYCSPETSQVSALSWAAMLKNKRMAELLESNGENALDAMKTLAKKGNSEAVRSLKYLAKKKPVTKQEVKEKNSDDFTDVEQVIYDLAKNSHDHHEVLADLEKLEPVNYFRLIQAAFHEKNYVVMKRILNLNGNHYQLLAQALKQEDDQLAIFLFCQINDYLKAALYLNKMDMALLRRQETDVPLLQRFLILCLSPQSLLQQLFNKILNFPRLDKDDLELFDQLVKLFKLPRADILNIFLQTMVDLDPQTLMKPLLQKTGKTLSERMQEDFPADKEVFTVMRGEKPIRKEQLFKLLRHFKMTDAHADAKESKLEQFPRDLFNHIYGFLDGRCQKIFPAVSKDFHLMHQFFDQRPLARLNQSKFNYQELQAWRNALSKEFERLDFPKFSRVLCCANPPYSMGLMFGTMLMGLFLGFGFGLMSPPFANDEQHDFHLGFFTALMIGAGIGFLCCLAAPIAASCDSRSTKLFNLVQERVSSELMVLTEKNLKRFSQHPELKAIKAFISTNRELLRAIDVAIAIYKTEKETLEQKLAPLRIANEELPDRVLSINPSPLSSNPTVATLFNEGKGNNHDLKEPLLRFNERNGNDDNLGEPLLRSKVLDGVAATTPKTQTFRA